MREYAENGAVISFKGGRLGDVVELKIFARWRCGSVELLGSWQVVQSSNLRHGSSGNIGASRLAGGPRDAQLLFASKTNRLGHQTEGIIRREWPGTLQCTWPAWPVLGRYLEVPGGTWSGQRNGRWSVYRPVAETAAAVHGTSHVRRVRIGLSLRDGNAGVISGARHRVHRRRIKLQAEMK